jgi:hypothetical protein
MCIHVSMYTYNVVVNVVVISSGLISAQPTHIRKVFLAQAYACTYSYSQAPRTDTRRSVFQARDFFRYLCMKHGNAVFMIGGIAHSSWKWTGAYTSMHVFVSTHLLGDYF